MESWLRNEMRRRGYSVPMGSFNMELRDYCRLVKLYRTEGTKVDLVDSKTIQSFDLGACQKSTYKRILFGGVELLTAKVYFNVSEFKRDVLQFLGDDGLVNPAPYTPQLHGQNHSHRIPPDNEDGEIDYVPDDQYSGNQSPEYEWEEDESFDDEPGSEFKDGPMEQDSKEDIPSEPSKECAVCLEELSRRMAFVPCGHANCCVKCSSSIQNCPTCRRQISHKVKLFL